MQTGYTFIGPFKQLITMADLPVKGALHDDQLTPIEDAGLILKGECICQVGTYTALIPTANELNAEVVEVIGHQVCLPGFVDSHTHICFGGTRARDYALRNGGSSYLEIAKTGGGIWDTVTHTRKASREELQIGIVKRANRHIRDGVTTIEVKSGYGLSVEEELKMLCAIQSVDKELSADLVSTCLAAHILPKDFDGNHAEYLTIVAEELFPQLKAEKLTNRIDAFIEEEAYSAVVIEPYFNAAANHGFDITVHADQFSTGGSEVAIRHRAVSADHLEASTEKEIELLAKSGVTATALPGASMGLGCSYAPCRQILDAGGTLAIATDWNPGSAPMGDLLMQAAVLGTFEKLTNAELLAGITYRAAHALRLNDRGQLTAGSLADFNVFNVSHYNELLYQQGRLKPSMVWKKGELAHTKKD